MPEEKPFVPNLLSREQLNITRHENFESWYANNVQYEPNEWDLRMLFGILALDDKGKPGIEQHTAMSISWPNVRVMLYFLQLQLAIFERLNGSVRVPQSVWPPEPTPPSDELKAANPAAQDIYDIVKRARDQFVAEVSQ